MNIMRLTVLLICAGLSAGCAARKPAEPAPAPPPAQPPALRTAVPPSPKTNRTVTVTPARAMTGRVASVNSAGRFVVLTFPLGTMPAAEKRLNAYRAGLKVGEVKVSGAPLDINIVADIVAGECQVGDEVREE